jgi:hypothetical protein
MPRQWGSGAIYVKSLFKLLAYLGVSQTAVWQHLGLKKPQISLWANGRRPMSLRYRERFEAFVWQALRRKYDEYYDAMVQELGDAGVAQWVQGNAAQEPLMFTPPAPNAPAVVQRWWAFHGHVVTLLKEWEVELSPEPLGEEVSEIALQLAPLATMDPDKRLALLLSSAQRASLLPHVERLREILLTLEQVDPRPNAEGLRSALLPPWPPARTPAARKAPARR